jgi:N6-adenosine-specific RNA methylase IME4
MSFSSALNKFNLIYLDMCEISSSEMSIGELAAEECALALWVQPHRLQESLDVMAAWGFDYKSILFVWLNELRGTTKNTCEFMLLGARGKGLAKRVKARTHLGSRGVSQVVITKGPRSAKPIIFENKLELLFGGSCYRSAMISARKPQHSNWFHFKIPLRARAPQSRRVEV